MPNFILCLENKRVLDDTLTFAILTILIFLFSYVNGMLDGSNVIATIITSRAMKPRTAIAFAAIIEFITPFSIIYIGSSVSSTIRNLVGESYYADPAIHDTAIAFIASGIIAAVIWNFVTWYFGIPSSASHALIGGVVGAGILAFGVGAISWNYFWSKVVLMVFLTPVLSYIVGYVILKLIYFITANMGVQVNQFFKSAQWFNMTFLAFNHALNDAQKTIGIMLIILAIFGNETTQAPVWVIACAAGTLALGIITGGFRVIKTVGSGIYRVRPVHSFASQLSSSLVIFSASLIGAPVSSSQIVASSIMGVGSAESIKAVRWGAVVRILMSWIITIPVAGMIGALFYFIISRVIF